MLRGWRVVLRGCGVWGAGGVVVLPDGFPGGGCVMGFVYEAAQVAGLKDDVVVLAVG